MFTKTFLSSLPRFKSGTLKKAPSNLKKLPQIAQLVKPTKPPKAFLKPHPEATSVNHLQGFFVHQDKYFYLTDGGVVYYHDGTRPLLMHATQFRKRLMRNFYAAKNMSKRGGGVYGEVLAHWSQYKHFVEEAGSVNAEVRHELRGIDYYDDVSDLSERVKSAIKKLIGGDKTYFERKIKEFEVLLTNAFFLRQNKILPSDFENLKKFFCFVKISFVFFVL
ncbi:hypothetical protein MHBO_004314 [Bonamia ostreae]|uniref:Bromo domain-containing protein n=1 Tax=Bonamia ostreae TaxID=126728 RepID=A0ABV2ASY9_9EUKA